MAITAQQNFTKISRLRIRNFRCFGDIDVPLDSLTAFVGPNGSGKTSLLRAMDLVLGEAWPTLRSFRIPQDFAEFDSSKDIEITVAFDPPYIHRDTHSKEHHVQALRLTCKAYMRSGKWGEAGDLHADIEPLDGSGQVPNVATGQPQKGQKTPYGPLRVGTELRDHARILFVDHRRSLTQHLPSVRGSILGKLFQKARKEFSPEDFRVSYQAAMKSLRTAHIKEIESAISATTKRMLGFLGRTRLQSLEIAFGFADPANPFNSLRLEYRESGLTVPGEELGLGIQSAMVVGIFEAFRTLGGNFGTVVIEEPEMYLHPQAQRYFYRLLCEMVEQGQCQVIYSTHSPIFADVNRFEALRIVRRSEATTTVTFVQDSDRTALEQARNNFKLGNRFDSSRNEVVFASKALLTEGYGDRVAALVVAEKLGFDLDAEGAVIVDCGGKSGIELVVRVCRALGIPFVVLHDEDVWPLESLDSVARGKQEKENRDEKAKNQRIRAAAGQSGIVYVISPSLEAALGVRRDASDKPRKIAEAFATADLDNAAETLKPLLSAVRQLMNPEGR